jgi:antagonist of KipI
MSLRVVDAGPYTLIVDFGRPGYRSLGVPVGGAADRSALAIGNGLVGNAPNTAALEISIQGPTLQAGCPLACVVYGAPFTLQSNRQKLIAGTTFNLAPGEELRIGGTPEGVRAYLCVRGGIESSVVLGSRSALEPLRSGVELACQPGTVARRFVNGWLGQGVSGRCISPRCPSLPPPSCSRHSLRVLEGPQADWFELKELYDREFTVTPASNRMGLRLEGEPLTMPDRELESEPVCPGSVQVTSDGQCIVLGVDGQTIGGYPKIAQVISADLDKLGQLRPRNGVRFIPVCQDEAERIYRQQRAELEEWLTRLKVVVSEGS